MKLSIKDCLPILSLIFIFSNGNLVYANSQSLNLKLQITSTVEAVKVVSGNKCRVAAKKGKALDVALELLPRENLFRSTTTHPIKLANRTINLGIYAQYHSDTGILYVDLRGMSATRDYLSFGSHTQELRASVTHNNLVVDYGDRKSSLRVFSTDQSEICTSQWWFSLKPTERAADY